MERSNIFGEIRLQHLGDLGGEQFTLVGADADLPLGARLEVGVKPVENVLALPGVHEGVDGFPRLGEFEPLAPGPGDLLQRIVHIIGIHSRLL
ncbi:hypothetical protein ACFL2P_04130 [Candidatus Moduliflexota bacterium]